MTYDPKEREQLEAAIAERQRQIDREETQRWLKENERRRMADAQPVVTPSALSPRREQAMGQDWQNYIVAEIRSATDGAIRACMEAVGETLAKQQKEREQLTKYLFQMVQEAELKSVQAEAATNRLSLEVAELKGRLDGRDEADVRRLKALKSVRPPALIA